MIQRNTVQQIKDSGRSLPSEERVFLSALVRSGLGYAYRFADGLALVFPSKKIARVYYRTKGTMSIERI